jgi:diacylglycerol kinase (ATP)
MKAFKVTSTIILELKLFIKVPNIFFVIAGGDGTICSVLNYIKRIPEWSKLNPPIAVLPLGTGNDLSRSLGWGGGAEEINPS